MGAETGMGYCGNARNPAAPATECGERATNMPLSVLGREGGDAHRPASQETGLTRNDHVAVGGTARSERECILNPASSMARK